MQAMITLDEMTGVVLLHTVGHLSKIKNCDLRQNELDQSSKLDFVRRVTVSSKINSDTYGNQHHRMP